MIKALFFDSGNVLVKEGFEAAVLEYERRHDIPKGQLYASAHDRSYWRRYTLGEISEQGYFEQMQKDFGQPVEIAELRTLIFNNFIPNQGLFDYLSGLKSHYKLGIISNNPKEWFDHFWQIYQWENIFSVRAVSSYIHVRKPDPKIFEYALQQGQVSGKESAYVDDRADRVYGAEGLGMKIVIYKNLDQLKLDISNLQ